ncbi:hypothetical protein B4100_1910 [Heyndrickxia coagulans]|nr:hypothetical protein B4100_1910 [Heyndrickxia coagulans]
MEGIKLFTILCPSCSIEYGSPTNAPTAIIKFSLMNPVLASGVNTCGWGVYRTESSTGRFSKTVMSMQKRQLLMKKSQYFQLPVIEDDIYRDLWIDEPAPPPLKTFDPQGQVLYIGSFSKTIAAGLRIGWLAGPESVIKRLSDLRMQLDYGSSYVSQMLVLEMLSSGLYDKHMERTRTRLKQKRDFLLQLLNRHLADYATWSKPSGGFFIWVAFKGNIDTRKLFKECLNSGVLINPGFIYDDHHHTVRLSFAYPSFEEMEEGILTMKALLADYG